MMLSLGMFVFELATLPFQEKSRRTSWRHARNPRVGARPSNQFLGPDDDTITLAGDLLPDVAGDPGSLDTLRQMADEGGAWPLTDGLGNVYGAWVIDSVEERQGNFHANGQARRYDFSINLHCVDDPAEAQPQEAAG